MASILIVEDDRLLNNAYTILLDKEGYTTANAFDGEEALAKAESFKPDLILLDLLMPNMGGLEFLGQFDLPNKHPGMKIIVFSNIEVEKEIEEAYRLGAHKYILKAWASPKELLKLIKDTLKH